jgi:hypothetical protein
MPPVSAMTTTLPTRDEWNAEVFALRTELRMLIRPTKAHLRHRALVRRTEMI